MLIAVAVPGQAFAAEQNCSLSQNITSNTNLSKIYNQLSQDTISKVKSNYSQLSCGKLDSAQLQELIKQYGKNVSVITPSKPSTPATPTKPTTPDTTTPTKPTTPDTTTPTKPADTDSNTNTNTNTNTDNAAIGDYEQQVVDLVNKERAAAGLSALKVNTKLASVAETKAEDLRDKNYFSHTSPTYGSPFDMMKQFGITYTAAGENIAKGQKTPSAVMNGWMNSEGHRANILNSSYTEIGVGYVTDSNGNTYWVQMFIRP
ncbi:serine protease [Anoxybacterium hadale]|uniref:Serine protease n=2 Tax=Anoxybacterium hadale TaxID=3408580 RepID=A0ACD1AH58_9FIRM|nr:serine protease [Clostridiales bacterium]